MKAVYQEVGHLFDNAADYIAQGIGLTYDGLRSDRDIDQLLREARPDTETDFDDLYQRRIKGLYGAILEFSSEAEPKMLPEQVEALNAIRIVGRDIVQAVKDVKHLQKNVARFAKSENTDIREQYAAICKLVAETVRGVGELVPDREASLRAIEALSAKVDAGDVIENGTLDQLIRGNKITPDMATSLINDNGYTQNIALKLIHGAQIVFGETLYELTVAAQEVALEGGEQQELTGSEARAASGA